MSEELETLSVEATARGRRGEVGGLGEMEGSAGSTVTVASGSCRRASGDCSGRIRDARVMATAWRPGRATRSPHPDESDSPPSLGAGQRARPAIADCARGRGRRRADRRELRGATWGAVVATGHDRRGPVPRQLDAGRRFEDTRKEIVVDAAATARRRERSSPSPGECRASGRGRRARELERYAVSASLQQRLHTHGVETSSEGASRIAK